MFYWKIEFVQFKFYCPDPFGRTQVLMYRGWPKDDLNGQFDLAIFYIYIYFLIFTINYHIQCTVHAVKNAPNVTVSFYCPDPFGWAQFGINVLRMTQGYRPGSSTYLASGSAGRNLFVLCGNRKTASFIRAATNVFPALKCHSCNSFCVLSLCVWLYTDSPK